jgi:hypothetical protein
MLDHVAGQVLAQLTDAGTVRHRVDEMQAGLEGRDGCGEVRRAQALPGSRYTMYHAAILRAPRPAGIHIC